MWKKRKRRALMRTPRNLLLGEPSLGPAPTFVHLIYQIILEINRQDVAILFVEHNARQALRLARRGTCWRRGCICPEGLSQELRSDKRIREACLGGTGLGVC